jgi:3-deoxy-manno-octulosonate cytidylyltransferase (CMP-KDO synthetase)
MSADLPSRVVAVIPARFASQRFPGKPLASIAGRPMIVHVLERARRATLVDEVLVATDDERIAAAVRNAGGKAVMTPASLRSGSDRIAYAVRSLPEADLIVNVQGDEPLLEPVMIDEAVRVLLDDPAVDVGTLVRAVASDAELENPALPKVVLDRRGYCLYFSRSVIPFGRDHAFSEWRSMHTYYKHVGLYVYRRAFLLQYAALPQTPLELTEKLEQLRILEHGFRIKAAITTHDSVPVDTPADLERVRLLIHG